MKGIPMVEVEKDGFSWEKGQYRPILFPPPKRKDFRKLILILEGIVLGITVLIFVFMVLAGAAVAREMNEIETTGYVVLMSLFFVSSVCQAISIFFVHRRKYFSLALGGAVFGIYLFPITLVTLGLLFYERRSFENRFEGRST